MIAGVCADCGKTWNVPAAGKVYRCRACGGAVQAVADAEEEMAAADGGGPSMPPPVPDGQGVRKKRAVTRVSPEATPLELATRDGARAKARPFVVGLSVWFGLQAALQLGVYLILGPALLFAAGSIGLGLMIFLGASVAGLLLATIRSNREPALWSGVVLAQAVSTVLASWLAGEGVATLPIILVAANVAALVIGLRAQQMLAAAARPGAVRSGPRNRSSGAGVAPGWTRTVGIALVGFSLVLLLFVTGLKAPDVTETAEGFTRAWASGKEENIASFMDRESRKEMRKDWQEEVQFRAWQGQLPPLGAMTAETREDSGVARTSHRISQGELTLTWSLKSYGWEIVGFEFPPIEAPPVHGAVDAWRDAWNARDLERLASMYQPDKRAGRVARLERLFERRGWSEAPKLTVATVDEVVDGRSKSTYSSPAGTFEIRWIYEQGAWCMDRIKLPRR